MPAIPHGYIAGEFAKSDAAANTDTKGKILEDLIRYVIELVPGVEFAGQNVLNLAGNEELDLVFWNQKLAPDGLYFLDTPFIVECKNWSKPVNGAVISVFKDTLKGRSCRDGILASAKGITGMPGTLQKAHSSIANAARDGHRILVLTRAQLLSMTNTDRVIEILKERVLEITLKQTALQ